jgi:hypothetical protein
VRGGGGEGERETQIGRRNETLESEREREGERT